jgi:tetratricopeptide (TPR) repeat protein
MTSESQSRTPSQGRGNAVACGLSLGACLVLACCLAGCERGWKRIDCFELAGERYSRRFYEPKEYYDKGDRLEAQAYYLYETNDLKEALECMMQLRGVSDPPRGATMIGVILTRMGNIELAAGWLELGLEESDDPDWAWGALIWHYCESGDYARAESAAKQLTEITASTTAWNALKGVRGLRRKAERLEEAQRALPWFVGGSIPVLLALAWAVRRWLKRRPERLRARHARDMEEELKRLNVKTSLSLEQVKARLLEARAKSNAAAFLHHVVVDGHLNSLSSSLRGMQGLMAIYRQSLEELDKLAIDEDDKEKRRRDLEKALKDMVRKLSSGDV